MEKLEKSNMKSPINFRAFLVVASAVVGAIFCAYFYMLHRAAIVVGIIYLLFLLTLVVIFALKFRRGRIRLSRFLTAIISLVFSLSAFSFAAAYSDFRTSALEAAGARQVDGRLCAVDIRDGTYTLILDDLALDGSDERGKMRVIVGAAYHNHAELLSVGDRVSFFSRVVGVPLVSGLRVNGTSFRTGIIFSCSVDGDELQMKIGNPKPIEKLLMSIRRILVDNMGDRYGNIAYSMITGDKYGLSSNVSATYSAAGLGHILAVSGLHVGFLILLIELILFRARKSVRFAVTVVLVGAYVVIADFSPSVIRAAIMATVSGAAVFVGGRRDLLSSLFFAFSCILAFRPLYLFEAGFLMSFGAIFGIALFASSIARFLRAHGAHNKISSSVGAALSVQAGIIPAQAYFFGAVQPLSVAVNLIMIPYITVVFIATLVCLPIAAIGFGGAVGWCRYLFLPIDQIAQGVAAVYHGRIAVFPSCALFLCYPVMFFASDFFMLPKSKLPLVLFSLSLCAVLCVL